MANIKPLLSAKRDDWCTPRHIIDLVLKIGDIGLDPCSNDTSIVPAATHWTAEDDGLASEKNWITATRAGGSVCYINPPYGRKANAFIERCWEFTYQRDVHAVALLPARTDTLLFHKEIAPASAKCFIKGRLTFIGAPHPAPFPSMLAYWGKDASKFQRVFRGIGWIP